MDHQNVIEDNQGFVILMAKKYNFGFVEFEDLVQAGNLGLLEARERFDETRGTSFLTYAQPWIKKYMIECNQGVHTVRIPTGIATYQSKIKKANREVNFAGERLSAEQLVELTKLNLKQVLEATIIKKEVEYNDSNCFNDYDFENEVLNSYTVKELFSVLSEKEINIIVRKFCHEATLQEIGDDIGRTRECVRLQINKVLDKLMSKGKRMKR